VVIRKVFKDKTTFTTNTQNKDIQMVVFLARELKLFVIYAAGLS
jgi:hypothetical protein